MKRRLLIATLLSYGSVLPAQDIEILSEMKGRPLPRAYFERLQEQPDAFELKDGWRRKLAAAQATASAVEGTLPLVIIPALFADSEAPDASISSSALESRLFDPASFNTVTSYFSEVSRGKLNISGRVTDWTPTTLTRATVVGTSFGLGVESKTRDWLREAIARADAKIDFGQFDNDGPDKIPNSGDDDGRVDGAAFLFREIDAACGGPGIWPHRSRFSGGQETAPQTNDPRPNGGVIVVDDYMVMGARSCGGNRPLDVNVFAHETGHILGLPDYYDLSGGILREQRRWVVGCWEIMSAGSWGCGAGPHQGIVDPPHMGAYTKGIMGWVEPKVVGAAIKPEQHTLRPAHSSGDALRIPLSATEYLLVEYRAKQGHDSGLPASGLLVYHIQTGRPFLPCPTCPRTYSYALLEADSDSALVRVETAGGNRGAATDAFGPVRTRVDDTTIPSTRLNDGTSTWVRLSGMIVDAVQGIARVTVSLAPARFTMARLASALGLTPLPNEDQLLLDTAGNGNGRFDVGDFRAYARIQAESN
jgi:M6 family metalloprotease-like protein